MKEETARHAMEEEEEYIETGERWGGQKRMDERRCGETDEELVGISSRL